jgi:hypothetical protein
VDAEQLERDRVDRRAERGDERGEPEQEERGPPPRPATTPASASEIDAGREDGEDTES